MKRVILILTLALVASVMYSQGRFDGFFKSVPQDIVKSRDVRGVSSWMFRPVVSISAMQINFDSPTTVQSLNSLGTGLSYAHFSDVNNQAYQTIAVNALVLFGTEITDVAPLELSLAVTATFWQYLSLGTGYNFTDKKIFLLTGISYSFNK